MSKTWATGSDTPRDPAGTGSDTPGAPAGTGSDTPGVPVETGSDKLGTPAGPRRNSPSSASRPQSTSSEDGHFSGIKRKKSTQRPKVPPKSPLVKAKSVPAQRGNAPFEKGSVAPPTLPPRINAPSGSTQSLSPSTKPPPPTPHFYAELEPSEPTPLTPSKKKEVVEVTTLQGLAKRPNDLPVLTRFIDGYYGKTSRFSVSSGDTFQFHFVKQTKVLSVKDLFGAGYAVPLNSASKFGLLYDQTKLPSSGHFKAVSDLLSLKSLPHVMCAQKCVQDKNRKVEVDEGDVLVVRGGQKKTLQCYNLRTKSEVVLNKHCEGHFTLDPDKTRMFPMDIVNHLPNVFPIKAKMYIPATEGESPNKIFTLLGSTIEISLLGTSDQLESGEMADIPVDENLSKLRIEVLASDNMPHLYEDAEAIAKSFDPSKCITFRDVGSDAAFDLQSALIKQVRPEEKNFGVQLCTSEYVYMKPYKIDARKGERSAYTTKETGKMPDTTDEDTNKEYSTIDDFLNVSEMARPPHQPETTEKPLGRGQTMLAAFRPPVGKNTHMLAKHSLSSGPGNVLATPSQRASKYPENEYTTISDFLPPNETAGSVVPQPSPALEQETKSMTETNRQFLITMDVPQMLDLLDAMKLSQYKEAFEKEQISGDVLMDCDEDSLEKDLGVNKKVHRIRLMKIMTGQHSAKNILEGLSPYMDPSTLH